jgi:DNA-binding winged helix-turn-helix (wHTH) protein
VRFDRFCIDQHRQQVSRNGARIRLQGKVYQVLIVLLQKQGEVVTREELKQALWSAHASRGGRCHLLDLSLCTQLRHSAFAKSKVRLRRQRLLKRQ